MRCPKQRKKEKKAKVVTPPKARRKAGRVRGTSGKKTKGNRKKSQSKKGGQNLEDGGRLKTNHYTALERRKVAERKGLPERGAHGKETIRVNKTERRVKEKKDGGGEDGEKYRARST